MEGWLKMSGQPTMRTTMLPYIWNSLKIEITRGYTYPIGTYFARTTYRDVIFVFQDDVACVPHLKEKILNVVQHLPEDWDMLYIGGKPFTYFKHSTDGRAYESDLPRFRSLACRGGGGLVSDQLHWRLTEVETRLSTNPIGKPRTISIIEPSLDEQKPIDVVLDDALGRDELNAYMLRHPCRFVNQEDGDQKC
jgi:hypothetical protein